MSTLIDFRKSAQFSQKLLSAQWKAHTENLAAIRANYIGNLLQQEIERENATYAASVASERQKLLSQLTETGEAMLATLKKKAATPPTQQQLTLLQALSMRSTITQREIEDIADQIKENYNACKTLADIAASKGYIVSFGLDYDRAIEDVETVVEYGKSMLEELGSNDMTYRATAFYGDYSDTEWDYLNHDIKGGDYMNAPKVEKRSITEAEQGILDQLFHEGKDYLATVEAVRHAYKVPELAKLIDMSSYAVCLEAGKSEIDDTGSND